MENIIAQKQQARCIISRFLKRVCIRNRAHEEAQTILSMYPSINESSILGLSLGDLPSMYKFYVFSNCRRSYTYDVRELVHLFRTDYQNAKCPYTRNPFTSYQKYFIMRQYYHYRENPEFDELILDRLSYKQYSECTSKLNSLLDDYNEYDITGVKSIVLLDLLTELLKWCSVPLNITLLNLSHYHAQNAMKPDISLANTRSFRGCVYLLLIELIEKSDDKYLMAQQIQARISYCSQIEGDPLLSHSRGLDILDLVDRHHDDFGIDGPESYEPPRSRPRLE
jgi:hypothetical protein